MAALPLALDLLGTHPLDEGLLPLGHGALAGELHLAGHPEPGLDEALELFPGAPGGQQVVAAVGQGDGEGAAVQIGLGLFEGAVEAGVQLFDGGHQAGHALGREALRREPGLQLDAGQAKGGALKHLGQALQVPVLHEGREAGLHPHQPLLAVDGEV